jgi:putative aldouronate transport system substrate-binding protein
MEHPTKPNRTSRRRFIRLAVAATVIPSAGALLSACGDSPTATRVSTAAATSTTVAAAATTSAAITTANATTAASATTANAATVAAANADIVAGGAPGVPDIYKKLPPPFKSVNAVPGRGGTVKAFTIAYGTPPSPREENRYWQELDKRLGVKWEVNLAPQTSYAEKLSVLTASGDLPDLTFVWIDGAPEQFRAIQQGAYTDLTPYLTGDALKEYSNLAAFPTQLWKNSAINGKIYGVPRPRFLVSNIPLYRKDWAEKVGVANPKNADDMFKMLEAFTKGDPNGNGQADTWGLALSTINSPFELIDHPLLTGMFRIPNRWRQEPDGNLSYYIEVPEYKEAITFLRRLWDAGLVYPDSLTQSKQQAQDNFRAGKFGLIQDGITALAGPTGFRVATSKLDPKADVNVLVPPGYDGGKGSIWLSSGFFGMASIPAKVGKDKERVKELLRIINYLAAPTGSEEQIFLANGLEVVHHDVQPDGSRVKNDLGKKDVSGDMTNLSNSPQVLYYPANPEQGPLMQNSIRSLLEVGVQNPALTAVSQTAVTKTKELNDLLTDRVTRIITGRDDIKALDGVIQEWKNRGGAQIAKELATALKG